MEKVLGARPPEVKFFHVTTLTIAGKKVTALRHGMAGQPGFELVGPIAEGDAVRDAIVKAGEEFGLRLVGGRAYSANTLESGWIPSPLPAVYSGEKMKPYRQWLKEDSYEARASIGGSFVSKKIEDYYLSPWDMGYGSFIDYEHDFIGREALQKMAKGAHRKKVTLALENDDVLKVIASQLSGRLRERRREGKHKHDEHERAEAHRLLPLRTRGFDTLIVHQDAGLSGSLKLRGQHGDEVTSRAALPFVVALRAFEPHRFSEPGADEARQAFDQRRLAIVILLERRDGAGGRVAELPHLEATRGGQPIDGVPRTGDRLADEVADDVETRRLQHACHFARDRLAVGEMNQRFERQDEVERPVREGHAIGGGTAHVEAAFPRVTHGRAGDVDAGELRRREGGGEPGEAAAAPRRDLQHLGAPQRVGRQPRGLDELRVELDLVRLGRAGRIAGDRRIERPVADVERGALAPARPRIDHFVAQALPQPVTAQPRKQRELPRAYRPACETNFELRYDSIASEPPSEP